MKGRGKWEKVDKNIGRVGRKRERGREGGWVGGRLN